MTASNKPAAGKISAVVSDVDGTLVTDDKRLTAGTQAAVAELHARGIIFTIISSRPPRGLRMLLDQLDIPTPIGCFNGGVIARPDLSVITAHLLSPQAARRAVDMLDARGAQSWVFAGQDWLVARFRRALCRAREAHGGIRTNDRRGIRTGSRRCRQDRRRQRGFRTFGAERTRDAGRTRRSGIGGALAALLSRYH